MKVASDTELVIPPVTSHVLDQEFGKPAQGMPVTILRVDVSEVIASGITDMDGRIREWDRSFALVSGIYRVIFSISLWANSQQRDFFYPEISVDFMVARPEEHFHIPLLLSTFGYSTYRGS